MREVRRWPGETQLFTMPGPDGIRRALRPCPFPVVAFRDDPEPELQSPGNLGFLSSEKLPRTYTNPFILDSGATAHMTYDASIVRDARPPGPGDHSTIFVGDGEPLRVTAIGTMVVNSNTCDGEVSFSNTLVVPELRQTLISIGALTAAGATGVISGGAIDIQHNGNTVLCATKRGGIYELRGCFPIRSPAAYVTTGRCDATLWHRRLGHLGYVNCSRLPAIVDGINTTSAEFIAAADDVCGDCLIGRHEREPRVSNRPKATEPLERLYVDLAGPFPVTSIDGERYYLIMVDEATRYTWVEPIKSKGDSEQVLRDIIYGEMKRTGKAVRYIRSDGGGEFLSNSLSSEWIANGIEHETTTHYSPESNGLAERSNRVIMEKARSLMSDAKSPAEFWGHAVAHAQCCATSPPPPRARRPRGSCTPACGPTCAACASGALWSTATSPTTCAPSSTPRPSVAS